MTDRINSLRALDKKVTYLAELLGIPKRLLNEHAQGTYDNLMSKLDYTAIAVQSALHLSEIKGRELADLQGELRRAQFMSSKHYIKKPKKRQDPNQ